MDMFPSTEKLITQVINKYWFVLVWRFIDMITTFNLCTLEIISKPHRISIRSNWLVVAIAFQDLDLSVRELCEIVRPRRPAVCPLLLRHRIAKLAWCRWYLRFRIQDLDSIYGVMAYGWITKACGRDPFTNCLWKSTGVRYWNEINLCHIFFQNYIVTLYF